VSRKKQPQIVPYEKGTCLRHHAGSTWEVLGLNIHCDYKIRCITGTVKPGWIGGEVEGTERTVHPEYLHGDGWYPEEVAPAR